jgi:hypothetical protein
MTKITDRLLLLRKIGDDLIGWAVLGLLILLAAILIWLMVLHVPAVRMGA